MDVPKNQPLSRDIEDRTGRFYSNPIVRAIGQRNADFKVQWKRDMGTKSPVGSLAGFESAEAKPPKKKQPARKRSGKR